MFQKTLSDCEVGSESLPKDWSAKDTYALRYLYNGELYILKGIKTEADSVFNLLVRIFRNSAELFCMNLLICEYPTFKIT